MQLNRPSGVTSPPPTPTVVAVQLVNDEAQEPAVSFAGRYCRIASEAPGKQRFASAMPNCFSRARLARAFSLSVIAIEEASKIPYLLECAEKISGGQAVDWPGVHKFLNSHQQKLMANLMNFKRVPSPTRFLRKVPRIGKTPSLEFEKWMASSRTGSMSLRCEAGGRNADRPSYTLPVIAEHGIRGPLAWRVWTCPCLSIREWQAKQKKGCSPI